MSNITPKFSFIVLLSFLFSCGNTNVDTTPPVVEFSEYNPLPIEDEICDSQETIVFRLTNNQELSFEMQVSDDEALSQYKIDIHNNFDCHGHGGGNAPSIPVTNVENQTTDWTLLDIQNLSGTTTTISRTLTVPDNVTAGNYHFQIQVIDQAGNDDPLASVFALKIQNLRDTISPILHVDNPTANQLSAHRGDTIRFVGNVSDNHSLSNGGNGILYLSYTDLTSGNNFNTDKAFIFDASVDKEYNFDFEYIIPQSLVARTYRFSLGAHDGVRNVASTVFFEIEILE